MSSKQLLTMNPKKRHKNYIKFIEYQNVNKEKRKLMRKSSKGNVKNGLEDNHKTDGVKYSENDDNTTKDEAGYLTDPREGRGKEMDKKSSYSMERAGRKEIKAPQYRESSSEMERNNVSAKLGRTQNRNPVQVNVEQCAEKTESYGESRESRRKVSQKKKNKHEADYDDTKRYTLIKEVNDKALKPNDRSTCDNETKISSNNVEKVENHLIQTENTNKTQYNEDEKKSAITFSNKYVCDKLEVSHNITEDHNADKKMSTNVIRNPLDHGKVKEDKTEKSLLCLTLRHDGDLLNQVGEPVNEISSERGLLEGNVDKNKSKINDLSHRNETFSDYLKLGKQNTVFSTSNFTTNLGVCTGGGISLKYGSNSLNEDITNNETVSRKYQIGSRCKYNIEKDEILILEGSINNETIPNNKLSPVNNFHSIKNSVSGRNNIYDDYEENVDENINSMKGNEANSVTSNILNKNIYDSSTECCSFTDEGEASFTTNCVESHIDNQGFREAFFGIDEWESKFVQPIHSVLTSKCDDDFKSDSRYKMNGVHSDSCNTYFNIYDGDPFLMREEDIFDNPEVRLGDYNSSNTNYDKENLNSVPKCDARNDEIIFDNVNEQNFFLASDSSHFDGNSEMGYYFQPYYYQPYSHEIGSYQDLLRDFALWSLRPLNRRRRHYNLDDLSAEENEETEQGAWFDRVLPEVTPNFYSKRTQNDAEIENDDQVQPLDFSHHFSETLYVNGRNEIGNHREQTRENFYHKLGKNGYAIKDKTNLDETASMASPTNCPLNEGGGFWNNPTLKARENFEKNYKKFGSIKEGERTPSIKNIPAKQNVNLIKSEILKIEKKYRNRIHRVNDVYLEDIKEDANEVKEEKQTEKRAIQNGNLDNGTKISYLQINLSKKERTESVFINEVKINPSVVESNVKICCKGENGNDKIVTKELRDEVSEMSVKLNKTSEKNNTNEIETSDRNETISVNRTSVTNNKNKDETLGKNDTENNEKMDQHGMNLKEESIADTKLDLPSSNQMEASTSQDKQKNACESLPDLLPNPTFCDHGSLAANEELEPKVHREIGKPKYLKSNSYSYTSINPTTTFTFEPKTGSLKMTKSSETKADFVDEGEKRDKGNSDLSFWATLGRLIGHKPKKETKKNLKSVFRIRSFKNTI